jgi:hypothetical protein
MKNIFNLVPQTNRTLLFAAVNPAKPSLYNLLVEKVDEAKLKEIEENYLVSSFDEFLEKFKPTLYSYLTNDDGMPAIKYTLEPLPDAAPVVLSKNSDIIKMLVGLIDQKDDTNIGFDYSKILDLMSPESLRKEISKLRKDMVYLYEKYSSLPDGDNKRKEIGKQLNKMLSKYKESFDNLPSHLIIAATAIRERNKLLEKNNSGNKSNEVKVICKSVFDDNGNIILLPIESSNQKSVEMLEDTSRKMLAEKIEEAYEKNCITKNIVPSNFIKDLLVREIRENNSIIEITEEDKKRHDLYCKILKTEKENYLQTILPLLNTILGVKTFFEQYEKTTTDKKYKPKLLITNCNAQEFCSEEGKKRLRDLLAETNDKIDKSKTFWFAIIPSVSSKEANEEEIEDFGFDSIDTNETGYYNCTLEELRVLSEVLSSEKIKIISFFNFIPKYENSFAKIQENWENIINITDRINNDYLVNCLPNFSIIPEGKKFNIGTMLVNDGNIDDEPAKEEVSLPGIYLDAAYVAAGLVAAYQSPEFLQKRFSSKQISDSFAGVRIDLEKGDNRIHLHTTMPIEITGYRIEFIEKVNKDPYGFLFASEKFETNLKSANNRITVLKARSLGKVNGVYKPIYKPLTKMYIERIIERSANGNITREKVENVIGNKSNAMLQDWKKQTDKINAVINNDDSIQLIENEVSIKFAKTEEILDLKIKEED